MRFVITLLLIVWVFCAGVSARTYDQVGKPKTYGKAKIASVGDVDGIYCFRCDIKGWPDIIGKDIPVRIDGIGLPGIVTEKNKFFEIQVSKFLSRSLKNAKNISLEKIKRGKEFCIVADVIVDSNSLADTLIKNGFARKLSEKDNRASVKKNTSVKPAVNKVIKISKGPCVASTNSKVFHTEQCRFAKRMKEDAKIRFPSRQKALDTGRRPCKICKP